MPATKLGADNQPRSPYCGPTGEPGRTGRIGGGGGAGWAICGAGGGGAGGAQPAANTAKLPNPTITATVRNFPEKSTI